jgi:hypothetical protein
MAVVAGCGGAAQTSSGSTTVDPDAGSGVAVADAGTAPSADPLAAAATCTSGMTWTQGDHGSAAMNPGRACITCHARMNGPDLTIAGTLYPTGHEPDLCYGADGADGARIVITGADGQTITLTPVPSGNFHLRTRVATPFTAKVMYMGRERAMTATQTSGDCNSCHTQSGANGAPGRITLP